MSEKDRDVPIGFSGEDDDNYAEVFGEHTFMDDSLLAELLTKEQKEAVARWDDLKALQKEYPDARDFLTDVLKTLIGVAPTDIQYDIMDYLQRGGGDYKMVQDQRGEAKTTITGIFLGTPQSLTA